MTALETVMNKYTCRSFKVTDYHADNEFDKQTLKNFWSLLYYMSMEEKKTWNQ